MKVIMEKTINSKLAQLVLCDDNITVKTLYDGKCIDSNDGNTYNNIKDEKWIQEAFIDSAVQEILHKTEVDTELDEMLKEIGW
jgi:hypothetical protein